MDNESLKQVLLDQQEELKSPPPHGKWIPRTQETVLRRALGRPLIKVIMGARRSGKSVLARMALSDQPYVYVNFDDERLAWLKTEDLHRVEKAATALWPRRHRWLLDEIQNVEGWELFVNRLQRSGRNMVITGSNSKLLSRELATHLTGRYVAVELYPFSFAEFLSARSEEAPGASTSTRERARIEERLDEYMNLGGFPEIALSGMSGEYLRELHDKIVARDIAARHRLKLPRTLKELSLHFFSNPAAPMTFNRIQRAFSFSSVHTAQEYVHYLEEAYLIFVARTFSFKFAEQLRQERKVYTIDNGLTNALSTKVSRDRGALLENLVFQELRRRGHDVYTWTQRDHGVDFLIRQDRKVEQLIQVCAELDADQTIKREYRALQKASKITRCRELLILTPSGAEPRREFIQDGPKAEVAALWRWLCAAPSAFPTPPSISTPSSSAASRK